MKIILTINGIIVKEQKLYPPVNDKYLSFISNFDVREEYMKKMIRTFKEKNKDKLIGSWEIIITVGSKINTINYVSILKEYNLRAI